MIDLNQIITNALTQAVEEATQPLRNQIQYLAEEVARLRTEAPKTEIDLTSVDFIGAVEAVSERIHKDLLADIKRTPDFADQIEDVVDKRFDRQIGKLADVPNFNQAVRDVVAELFSDEGKDLISEHVESVIEDYDFSDKLDDIDFDDKVRSVLKYNLSLTVTVD